MHGGASIQSVRARGSLIVDFGQHYTDFCLLSVTGTGGICLLRASDRMYSACTVVSAEDSRSVKTWHTQGDKFIDDPGADT